MLNHWENKLALITGASSGIGASIAKLLSSKGISVILVARNQEKLSSLCSSIISSGGNASYLTCDLSKSENRILLYKQIVSKFGIPDILINNAGVGWYGFFSEMSWKDAENLIELNIIAPTHLISLFLQDMLKKERSHIINIGSIIGKLPEQGVALYSASKGYLDSFTKSLYRELKRKNLSISIIRAGPVKTEFFDSAARISNGRRIPAESLAISPERVAVKTWSLLNRPRRYSYVPFYLLISPLLETFFSWILDLVGPILLNHSKNKSEF
jgi:uncharacterized protein